MAKATVLFFMLSPRSENLMYTLSNETDTQRAIFFPVPPPQNQNPRPKHLECQNVSSPKKTKKEKGESIQDILYYILCKKLPKAQRSRGFSSYHKILHIS